MATATALPDLIAEAQTTEEAFLRQIFVRDQMAEWSKQPLVMARADDVYYWDVTGKTLSRRDLGHLRRLGGPQQPAGDRGDPATSSTSWRSRRRCTAPIRWPCSSPTCWPSSRPATCRPSSSRPAGPK